MELMDDAWWGGTVPPVSPDADAGFMVSERSMPHSILIDAAGKRFSNESESYVDLGHHMRDHGKETPGKYWLSTDSRHAHRHLRSYARTRVPTRR